MLLCKVEASLALPYRTDAPNRDGRQLLVAQFLGPIEGICAIHSKLAFLQQVLEQLRDEFGIELPPADDPPVVESAFDRETQVLSVSATRETPEEAADLVNNVIAIAISKSTEERVDYLNRSLVFYNRLISEAEADAASKRQAKQERIEAMRAQFSIDPDAEIEFEEVSQVIGGQRERLAEFQLELRDADRLEMFLKADEKLLVSQIMKELPEDYKEDLRTVSKPFTPTSPQAIDIANRIKPNSINQINFIDQHNIRYRDLRPC